MKKYILLTIAFLSTTAATFACPICEAQQPKILRGITHGAGPESNWDFVIVGLTAVIVLVALFYAVKWLIRPGERNANHIKRTILNFD